MLTIRLLKNSASLYFVFLVTPPYPTATNNYPDNPRKSCNSFICKEMERINFFEVHETHSHSRYHLTEQKLPLEIDNLFVQLQYYGTNFHCISDNLSH